MRIGVLFIAMLGCSGSGPASVPPHLPVAPPPPDAATTEPTPLLAPRGGACAPDAACAPDLLCLPTTGGYCTSPCGLTGTACPDGSCVATARAGELCLQACARDTECRVDEGYVCDPQWNACLLPNTAAIVPNRCPPAPGPLRDPAFAASTQLSTRATPGIYQLEPTAALTSDGGLFALFSSRGAITATSGLGAAIVGGGAPQPATALASGTERPFAPWVARDARGTLFAVALGRDARSTNQRISLTISRDGGRTWSAPTDVHDPTDATDATDATDCRDGEATCLDKPRIAIGPDPKRTGGQIIYVLYAARAGLRVRASRDAGATFGPAVTALAGSHGNAAVGSDGRLHLVTLDGGPSTGAFGAASHAIEYTVSSDGGTTFAKPRRLSARDETLPFFFSNPSIAVDTRRKWLYAAYTRGGRDAVWDLVILASKDHGATWRRTRIGDAPPCAIHMVPNLALDPTTGTVHVTWYDSRGGGRFAHATCPPGAKTCTQRGAINDVPFAALSTVRDGAAWIGDYQALVIDDQRRTLHAVWTQPIDDQGAIVSRIFHAAAKLPRR